MRLLIYDNEFEPISAAIIKNKKKLNVKILHLKDLIDNVEIFDEFDSKKTKIRWYISDKEKVTNSNKTFVVNRLFNFSDELFNEFSSQDKEYAKSEFWAYLVFSLNSFKNITENPGIGALAGQCLSLPQQWDLIEKNETDVSTPDFYCGPEELLIEEFKNNCIFTNPYNFYTWKVNEPKKSEEDNVFAIKKPKGHPVLAFNVGKKVYLYDQEHQKKEFSDKTKEKIKFMSKKIHKIFNYFISEILFFVDDENITFAMISNKPFGSAYGKEFEQNVIDALLGFFEKNEK